MREAGIAWLRCQYGTAEPVPDKFRMQFSQGRNQHKLKTLELQRFDAKARNALRGIACNIASVLRCPHPHACYRRIGPIGGGPNPAGGHPDGAEATQHSPIKNRAGPLPVQNSPCSPLLTACAVQNSPCSLEMAQFGVFCACVANFLPFSPGRSHAGRTLYRIQVREGASHNSTPRPASVEGAGGTGGPGCGARGRRRGLAGALSRRGSPSAHRAPQVWRAPEAWLRHPRAAAGCRHSPPTGTRTTPEHDLIRPTRTTPRRIGTKLSPHTRPRRIGTKLSPHTRPRRMSGIKLSPLTRNGPIWRVLPAQGEFCTALVSKTPSRENFVSVSPPRIHAGRTLYRTQGTNRANHNSTPRTTGVERTSGTTGPRRGIRGRRRHHRQANFACNSPTAQTNASSKTAEYQRSHFNT